MRSWSESFPTTYWNSLDLIISYSLLMWFSVLSDQPIALKLKRSGTQTLRNRNAPLNRLSDYTTNPTEQYKSSNNFWQKPSLANQLVSPWSMPAQAASRLQSSSSITRIIGRIRIRWSMAGVIGGQLRLRRHRQLICDVTCASPPSWIFCLNDGCSGERVL